MVFSVPNRTAGTDFWSTDAHTHSIGRSYANAPKIDPYTEKQRTADGAALSGNNECTAGSVPWPI